MLHEPRISDVSQKTGRVVISVCVDKNGKVVKLDLQTLSSAARKKKFTIASLSNSSDEFLKYLDKIGLSIGDVIEITDKEEFDKSILIKHKKRVMSLSDGVAKNILVSNMAQGYHWGKFAI